MMHGDMWTYMGPAVANLRYGNLEKSVVDQYPGSLTVDDSDRWILFVPTCAAEIALPHSSHAFWTHRHHYATVFQLDGLMVLLAADQGQVIVSSDTRGKGMLRIKRQRLER
jgi:hypothetical protein